MKNLSIPVRWLPGLMLAVVILILSSPAPLAPAPAQAQTVPYFEPADCMFEIPAGVDTSSGVECGYLIVPEEHANPVGPTIHLAVAIIKSHSENPQPDPLFIAQGGPGGSTIDTYAESLLYGFGDDVLQTRDVVLLEQRGTLYSEPSLLCDEVFETTLETMQREVTLEEVNQAQLDALQVCRERLLTEGINLSAYDSVENAADVAALHEVLGYESYNFYGVSYGTMLGQHLLRDHPDGLRSVILDAIVPLPVMYQQEIAYNAQQSFNALFTACATDPVCNAAYPDLEAMFYQVLDQLTEEPARFTIRNMETGDELEAVMDEVLFTEWMFSLMYQSGVIPQLPRIIHDAASGEYEMLRQLIGFMVFEERKMSIGMYASVICAEDYNFDPAQLITDEVDPRLLAIFDPTLDAELCRVWQVEPLDDFVNEAIRSDIPVLMLSGEFDPITPYRWVEGLAANLPNGYAYVFPGESHGIFLSGASCPNQMILEFLTTPDQAPDAACIETMQVAFITPDMAVTFEDYTNTDFGFQTVLPADWIEVLPGTFARSTMGDVLVMFTAFPGSTQFLDADTLGSAMNAEDAPVLVETRETNAVSWQVYRMTVQGVTIHMALADGQEQVYMVLLQSFPADAEALYQQILVPVLDAFVLTN